MWTLAGHYYAGMQNRHRSSSMDTCSRTGEWSTGTSTIVNTQSCDVDGILKSIETAIKSTNKATSIDSLAAATSRLAAVSRVTAFVMAALRSRRGHYIFVLFLRSFFLFSFFFSSPNLSGRRLDTFTHGVARVRI